MKVQEASEIYALYLDYYKRATHPYIKSSILNSLKSLGGTDEERIQKIAQITITLPVDVIKNLYKKHGVIQLRDVKSHKKLLLGCGNNPIEDLYDKKHSHEGFITVNPEISMNPTVVGAFGIDKGLKRVLPFSFYTQLFGERVTLSSRASAMIDPDVMRCMKPRFKTFEIGEESVPVEFTQSNLFWEAE